MGLRDKQLAFHITTCCSLNCKLCVTMVPCYKERKLAKHIPLEQMKREIDEVFHLYEFLEDITLSGGEPLLHPDVGEIVRHCLQHYRHQFGHVRIFTNGTIVPDAMLLEQLKESDGQFQLVVDNYGPNCSIRVQEIKDVMEQAGLPLRINQYHGGDQHCGGWVDYGSPTEFRDYPDEVLEKLYQNCHVAQYKCIGVYNGKLVNCCWAIFGSELGLIPDRTPNSSAGSDDMVDLFDVSVSAEEKRHKIARFGEKPLWACQYCNGFDPEHSPRFPAGEQA